MIKFQILIFHSGIEVWQRKQVWHEPPPPLGAATEVPAPLDRRGMLAVVRSASRAFAAALAHSELPLGTLAERDTALARYATHLFFEGYSASDFSKRLGLRLAEALDVRRVGPPMHFTPASG